MKIFAITDNDSAGKPKGYRSTWAYQELYHGTLGVGRTNEYGRQPYHPFPLVRNVSVASPVFFASVWMIVNGDISSHLKKFPNVDLIKCDLQYAYEYSLDEASILKLLDRFSEFEGEEFSDWKQSLYKVPKYRSAMTDYFQVLAPRFQTVAGGIQATDSIKLPGPVYKNFKPLPTAPSLHETYPILTEFPYYLCTQSVYSVLAEHVHDPALFKVYEIDIVG